MKDHIRLRSRVSRLLFACLFAVAVTTPATAGISLYLRGDYEFCTSEITSQRCIQIPVTLIDDVGGTNLGLVDIQLKMSGPADNLLNGSSGEYWVVNLSASPIDRTGITNPPTDLSNSVIGTGSPTCSTATMLNSATEGQGSPIDFPTITGSPILEVNNSGTSPPGLRTILIAGFGGFLTTVQNQEILFGVLEIPIAANPQPGTLVISATTQAERPDSNTFADGSFANQEALNTDNAVATITFTGPPSVQTQPTSQFNICSGDTVDFTVASDTPGITYQWQKDTVNLPGETSSTLQLTNVVAGNAGSYRCVLTNSCGSTNTNAATLTIQPGVTLNQQPVDASVCEGQNASFSVNASGDGAISYQWRFNGGNIGGETGSTLTLNAVSQSSEGSYDCLVTSDCGTITTTAATLNVAALPTVTSQPTADPSYCPGDTATFTVAGSTESSLTYQWFRGPDPLSGETSATLTLSSLVAGNAGNYSCRLTDSCGSVSSNTVTLNMTVPVTIDSITADVAACPGDSPSLTVSVSGDGPFTYQWRKDGGNLAGQTAATLSLTNVAAGDAGAYTCVVSNACGPVTSAASNLTVSGGISFSANPQPAVVCEGQNATFTVTASGQGTLTYQWRRNGTDLPGETTASLTLNTVAQGDEATYDCFVTSDCGSAASAGATLTVAAPPTIQTHPQSEGPYCPDGTAIFTVAGVTESSFTYQWLKDGDPIAGQTTATLTLTNLSSLDLGNYSCRLTDDCGQVTSNTAAVTLNQPISIDSISADAEACPGDTASFTVSVSGDGPLAYQWRKDGEDLTGETSATISFNPVGAGDNGVYTCVVTGPCNTETSAEARLFSVFQTFITAPNTTQGLNPLVFGNTVFCGAPDFSYSWTVQGNPAVLGTGPTFTLDPIPQATTTYVLTVTDAGSSQATDQVTVIVSPITLDPNGDGRNDLEDLYFMIQEWAAGDLEFDADADEEMTILDILHVNWNIQIAR